MKRYIKSSNGYKGYSNISEYVRNTDRDKIEFEIPQIWSIQFFGDSNYMINDTEVFVMAKTYEEAYKQAKMLCKAWDYSINNAIIQFAFQPRTWWNRHAPQLEGTVQYVED